MKRKLTGLLFTLTLVLILGLFANISPLYAQSPAVRPVITTGNAAQVTQIASLQVGSLTVNKVLFSPDGAILVAAVANHDMTLFDNTISLWTVATKRAITSWQHIGFSPSSLTFSPDGSTLAALGYDLSNGADKAPLGLLQWDTTTGSVKKLWQNPFDDWRKVGLEDGQSAAAYSPDGKIAVSGNMEGAFFLWDSESGQMIGRIENNQDSVPNTNRYEVNRAEFSRDGKLLITSNGDGTIRFWQVNSGAVTAAGQVNSGKQEALSVFAVHPNGMQVAAASTDAVILWDVSSKKITATLPYPPVKQTTPPFPYNVDLVYNADGSVLAVLTGNRADNTAQITLYDTGSGKSLAVIPQPEWSATIAMNASGTLLASGSSTGKVYLWGVSNNP